MKKINTKKTKKTGTLTSLLNILNKKVDDNCPPYVIGFDILDLKCKEDDEYIALSQYIYKFNKKNKKYEIAHLIYTETEDSYKSRDDLIKDGHDMENYDLDLDQFKEELIGTYAYCSITSAEITKVVKMWKQLTKELWKRNHKEQPNV